jgi:hypothetical protein
VQVADTAGGGDRRDLGGRAQDLLLGSWPMNRAHVLATLTLSLLAATSCDRKKEAGLPPAPQWQAGGSAAPAPDPGAGATNPHAGVPGAPEINPHAGVPGAPEINPHAGVPGAPDISGDSGGTDVAKLGLPPPDPSRPISADHYLKGTIRPAPALKDKVAQGGAIFVTAKRMDAAGQPTGAPLAVEKLQFTGDGITFELTEADAMIAGTKLEGEVIISARYDQDHDAISKQPGDVAGTLKVKVPADNLVLVLDQPL